MNIAKALKTKNRLVGDLARYRTIFTRENSKRVGESRQVDLKEVQTKIQELEEKIVAIKTSITQASAEIAEKLVRLSELKGKLAWLKELPIVEGPQTRHFSQNQEPEVWEAFLNTQGKDQEIEKLQEEINVLQDEIDDFNAATTAA